MYQQLTIVGNLGADPVMRHLPSGDPVTNFSVATNRRWTNQDGSKGEETTWFRVAAWRRMAEVCHEYLSKGRLVLVTGRLIPSENGGPRIWQGQDGQSRASFEVTAETVKFLGGRNNGATLSQEGVQEPEVETGEEEDIPF